MTAESNGPRGSGESIVEKLDRPDGPRCSRPLLHLLKARQKQRKDRASLGVIAGGELPFLSGDNELREVQAETDMPFLLLLRTVEAIENIRKVFFRKARSVIPDCDPVLLRCFCECDLRRPIPLPMLHAVSEKVPERFPGPAVASVPDE